jgi:thiosulfate dehydrogenase (quinone) large subunit
MRSAQGRHHTRPAVAARVLLPLRLFLGLTFLDAGAGKLLAPAWIGTGPQSFAVQARGFAATSPIGSLLRALVLSHPLPSGFLLAVGELAVGLLTLAGLATRLAAGAGLGLSLLFFLTASWHVRPFFYGPDLPFAVAWLPLLLAGHAGLPSLDRVLQRNARRQEGLTGDGDLAAVPADRLREACQAAGRSCAELCRRPHGRAGQAAAAASRRAFLASAGAAGLAVVGTTVAGGALAAAAAVDQRDAGGERAASARPPTATRPASPTTGGASTQHAGQRIGRLGQIPVGQAASFRDPATGRPVVAVRLSARHVVAYDAVCTHAGCTVGFDPGSGLLACPCHGAAFDPRRSAAVVSGPAETPLPALRITVGPDGGLYVRA